ncbi:MAG: peptide chain release factor N(5)-glutamine methyltransferase [Candidatus Gastranaerophilaceae bacterium]
MNYRKKFYHIYKNSDLDLYEINSEVDFVIDVLFDLKGSDFLLGKELNEEQCLKATEILDKHVLSGIPLQYLVGQAFFCGNKYFVDENTLIPRPETEFLVDACKKLFTSVDKIKILDMGTGTGCIAIELAKYFKNAEITAIDVCQPALDTALKNAKIHNVEINFVLSDIFSNVEDKFDLIVSNPPYISKADVVEVAKDVYEYEPHRALFAEDDGYYFYCQIVENAYKYLLPNGKVAFELGKGQHLKVAEFFKDANFSEIRTIKDCDDVDRIIFATLI